MGQQIKLDEISKKKMFVQIVKDRRHDIADAITANIEYHRGAKNVICFLEQFISDEANFSDFSIICFRRMYTQYCSKLTDHTPSYQQGQRDMLQTIEVLLKQFLEYLQSLTNQNNNEFFPKRKSA